MFSPEQQGESEPISVEFSGNFRRTEDHPDPRTALHGRTALRPPRAEDLPGHDPPDHARVQLPERVATIDGLTYDQANELLAAFNNGTTSFDGRVW